LPVFCYNLHKKSPATNIAHRLTKFDDGQE
jgi:hypothetical protein